MKRTLTCFCEETFDQDFPNTIGLTEEVKKAIFEGDFLTATCPGCGKVLKPEFPVLIYDSRAGSFGNIFFIPERDRSAYFLDMLTYQLEDAPRVVIGYDELTEKLRLVQSGLDDRVIEVIKYYLLNRALSETDGKKDLRITFHEMKEETLEFYARGVKEDKIGVLNVPVSMYNKAEAQAADLQEPLSGILQGPYISVNKVFFQESD
ncbi:MAG TPA: hypothetical protein ENI27_05630 [bacterium]|nr:hypothetical protein [bacterium]